jgi:hypothetical protein
MHQCYVYVLNEITLRPYAIKITATLALLQVFTSVHDHVLMHVGDFQKNEDFSFSENNLNIK